MGIAHCPVCDSNGKIEVSTKVGQLNVNSTVYVTCWACKGTGLIKYKEEIKMTDSVIGRIKESSGISKDHN